MHGRLTQASISRGFEVKLDEQTPIETVRVGEFALVEGLQHHYLAMITDLRHQAPQPQLLIDGLTQTDSIGAAIFDGEGVYSMASLSPMVEIDGNDGPSEARIRAVKSIPSYRSAVREAQEEDLFAVFGRPWEGHGFAVGGSAGSGIPVCVDLEKFVKRSVGIFGRNGTGKSFLTRLLLAGIVAQRDPVASLLVFDAHNEYGMGSTSEAHRHTKGLKELFGTHVFLYTLDPISSRRRSVQPDGEVRIGYDQIEPQDIAAMAGEMHLNDTALETIYVLRRRFGAQWMKALLTRSPEEIQQDFEGQVAPHPASLAALVRHMERIRQLPFVVEHAPQDAAKEIVDHLMAGDHVVLEFGNCPELGYLLAANLITRQIHERYVRAKEEAYAAGTTEPSNCVIVLEEAHKFLNPEVAHETLFGTIAREMRKYNVTLLIVDQTPSQIDPEVISQLGTRITCKLESDRDIDAFLAGAPFSGGLRNILLNLEQQQEALLLGYAVPTPVVVQVRPYDQGFYEELRNVRPFPETAETDKLIDDLYGNLASP